MIKNVVEVFFNVEDVLVEVMFVCDFDENIVCVFVKDYGEGIFDDI